MEESESDEDLNANQRKRDAKIKVKEAETAKMSGRSLMPGNSQHARHATVESPKEGAERVPNKATAAGPFFFGSQAFRFLQILLNTYSSSFQRPAARRNTRTSEESQKDIFTLSDPVFSIREV